MRSTVTRVCAAVTEATRAQDALFRFKIDFVRKRALPLIKGGAHVTLADGDGATTPPDLEQQLYNLSPRAREAVKQSSGLFDGRSKRTGRICGIAPYLLSVSPASG